MILFTLLLLLKTTLSFALPEASLPELWKTEVLPAFKKMQSGQLTNHQGLKLKYYYSYHPSRTKNLVIVPGRTEPAIKYAELIYDLSSSKLNIFILDHQGQGESQRLLKDSHKGHVLYFSDYIRDFSLFIDEVVLPRTNSELYLLAHSMGAAISVHFMKENPTLFKKAVLSSPMMELNTEPYTETVARYFFSLLVLAQRGTHYAPDRGPYVPDEDTFQNNEVTHSLARFEISKFLFTDQPKLALGGPTNRWVNQSLKATKNIARLAPEIRTPILLFQSGLDLIVRPRRQEEFCQKHNNCRFKLFPQAHHEILMEEDYIRNEALRDITLFLGF